MSEQPEALRLADELQAGADDPMWAHHTETPKAIAAGAAAELRRLHEAHDWQYKMAGDRLRRIEKLERINAQLLEALELHAQQYPHMQKGYTVDAIAAARASDETSR